MRSNIACEREHLDREGWQKRHTKSRIFSKLLPVRNHNNPKSITSGEFGGFFRKDFFFLRQESVVVVRNELEPVNEQRNALDP